MPALHLLQSALVHVNTALLQVILAEPEWVGRMTDAAPGPAFGNVTAAGHCGI